MENCLKLKNLSKTRWSARAESVEAVWRSLEAIICALDDVKASDDKEAKFRASALLNGNVNIDFVCGLMFLKNIMPQTKTLSDYLQKKRQCCQCLGRTELNSRLPDEDVIGG